MYQNAYLPAVGENGGVHRVSGYRMGYAVDGVTPSTGSGQHGGRLPIDVGGANTGKSKVYAGNDMVALACGSNNQGVWFFSSAEPLVLVSGEICYILLECIHMTAADRSALGLAAGKTIPAGGWMYSEGTAGGASMHLHIDFGRAQDKPKTGKCPWHSIGGGSYAPDDNYPINRALHIPAGMTVYGGTELGGVNGQWISAEAGAVKHYEEESMENNLQKLCIVDASDSILASAREKGLPVEQRTCYLIGPASCGDAMDLWMQAQAEGRPYFASTTEV